MSLPVVKLKRLSPLAVEPSFAYDGDAFSDMVAVKEVVLWPGKPEKIPLGWSSEMDPEYYIEVRPKSGLASTGIMVANSPGTIDSNYRGEWLAIMVNVSQDPYKVHLGEKVVQVGLKKKEPYTVVIVDELSETSRGKGACGSSGKFVPSSR